MTALADRDVLKDRRTNAEALANSAQKRLGVSDPHASAPAGDRLRFDRYVLDLRRGCLLADEREVALRPKTFELLLYLASHPGRLVSKDELLAAVWPGVFVCDDSLVQCVTELRRALADRGQTLIKTLPRRGYRFDAIPVVEEARARPPGSAAARLAWAIGILVLAALIGVGIWWALSDRSRAPPLSIAVMPFVDLGAGAERGDLIESLAYDLTTDLSRLPDLLVIAYPTARTFKGTDRDAREVGLELNVRYLLDGNLYRSGDQLRIIVQLIDTASGASVWGNRFERRRDELPGWRDEVIGRIANALNFRLTALESERSLHAPGNPEAIDLTTRGWALVYSAKAPRTYRAARELFEQAAALDLRAVNAFAGIAWTTAIMVLDGWSTAPAEELAAAETAIAQTLALDPNHVVAHHARGFVWRLQRRTQSAHDAFRTVVALNPNFAPGYAQLGVTALELGRPAQTVPFVERAITLSPRDPNLGPWLAIAGMAMLHLGRDEEAVSWLTRAVDTGTPVALHQAYLASALALVEREQAASEALALFREAKPAATIARLRGAAYSTAPDFVAQRERLYTGLRLAGLPD
jgi:TolB-like protein/DNA-binding winged helix-turn-helix (wHTH) protein/Tfp pilus assembly protein PilF